MSTGFPSQTHLAPYPHFCPCVGDSLPVVDAIGKNGVVHERKHRTQKKVQPYAKIRIYFVPGQLNGSTNFHFPGGSAGKFSRSAACGGKIVAQVEARIQPFTGAFF